MSGILNENPYIEEFSLWARDGYVFLNVNNFIDKFEDYNIGQSLKTLELIDSFRFTELTKFL